MALMPQNKKLVYLDYAAATPLHPLAKKAMEPFLGEAYGNPSSLHQKGIEAKKALEAARAKIAQAVGVQSREIIFTSGGTESCNLAVLGIVQAYKKKNAVHAITTVIEHHAVLESFKRAEKEGSKVTYLPVSEQGLVDPMAVIKSVRPETVLVSVMYANNEIGSIQPIVQIAKLLWPLNIKRKAKGLPEILLHTDACQAPGLLDVNPHKLGVDLMSFSASKFYGPKGSGFLYVKKGIKLSPIIFGGGQEKALRSGTENLAGAAGMAEALALANNKREQEIKRLTQLRDFAVREILKIPDTRLNGPAGNLRLANNINFSVKNAEGEALMLYLDASGICVSTASACSTNSTERSHVIKSIKVAKEWSNGTIRITLGKFTQKKDLIYALKVLKKNILLLRRVVRLKES